LTNNEGCKYIARLRSLIALRMAEPLLPQV
jgi:hypothetical protein